jgi:hypothetical protein
VEIVESLIGNLVKKKSILFNIYLNFNFYFENEKKEEDRGNSIFYLWKCRFIESLVDYFNNEKKENLINIFLKKLFDEKWFKSLSNKALIAFISMVGSLISSLGENNFLKNNDFKKFYQILSNIISNEDISEGKQSLFNVLVKFQINSKLPFILPEADLKIGNQSNSTFSKHQ